jgi:hypothetical protein
MRGAILTLIFAVCSVAQVFAQGGFGVAYYDVDNLYDTKPSKFYDDSDYTPTGRRAWTEERYAQKVANVAQVIDSMRMPVVVLYGVENEQVVRDIVEASGEDYAYIHRTQDYSRGLDFALLYFADKFFVEQITPWRGALCVEGEVGGREVAIVATKGSTSLGVLFAERNLNRDGCNVILLGEPSRAGFDGLALKDYSATAERSGRGNVFTAGGWRMRDRVACSVEGDARCDVFIKSWLLDSNGAPKPTYDKSRYRGGYSTSLPIYIYFSEMFYF